MTIRVIDARCLVNCRTSSSPLELEKSALKNAFCNPCEDPDPFRGFTMVAVRTEPTDKQSAIPGTANIEIIQRYGAGKAAQS